MVSFLFAVALIIVFFFVVLALHIIVLPVKFSGRLRSAADDLFLGVIKWGLIRASVKISAGGTATLYLFSFRLKEFPLREKETKKKEGEEEKQPFDAGKIKPLFDETAVILREINFDYFRLNAKIGLGDPAGTGVLFGLISALKGILSCSDRFELNVIPVFETEALDCEIEAGFRICRLYRIIAPAIRIFRTMRTASNTGVTGNKKSKGEAVTAGRTSAT